MRLREGTKYVWLLTCGHCRNKWTTIAAITDAMACPNCKDVKIDQKHFHGLALVEVDEHLATN